VLATAVQRQLLPEVTVIKKLLLPPEDEKDEFVDDREKVQGGAPFCVMLKV